MNVLYSSSVLHGDKTGRAIGFPTLNLDPAVIPADTKLGVYRSVVTVKNMTYTGALYFGPRSVKNEVKNVLEIYLLNFHEEVYGEQIRFTLAEFIRPVIHFTSLKELTTQLQKDVTAISTLEGHHETETK